MQATTEQEKAVVLAALSGEVADLESQSLSGDWLARWLAANQPRIHHRGARIDNGVIEGDIDMRDGRLTRPLVLDKCVVKGSLVLDDAETRTIRVVGCSLDNVSLQRARIDGNLSCSLSTVGRFGPPAIPADGLMVTGDMFIQHATLNGGITLIGAKIGRSLEMTGTRITTVFATAFNADRIEVNGSLFLRDVEVNGQTRIPAARIGGVLEMDGATLAVAYSTALELAGTRVAGSINLRHAQCQGEVRMPGVECGGQVELDGTTIVNEGAVALRLDGISVEQAVMLRNGFHARGTVRMIGARIGGELYCDDATFERPDEVALGADGAEIGGDVRLPSSFVSRGEVRLVSTSIGGHLICRGTLAGVGGSALTADAMQVAGGLFLEEGPDSSGIYSLHFARCLTLEDNPATWPRSLVLQGFEYSHISSPATAKERLDWLRRQIQPSAQPYRQLASYYSALGDRASARRVNIARENDLLHPPAHWMALPKPERSIPSGWARVFQWLWRQPVRGLVGHGYAPHRVLYLALPLVMLFALLTAVAVDQTPTDESSTGLAFIATDTAADADPQTCTPSYPCLNPLLYSMDTIIPIVDLNQREHWRPNPAFESGGSLTHGKTIEWLTAVLSLIGWAVGVLFVASFTSVIRSD